MSIGFDNGAPRDLTLTLDTHAAKIRREFPSFLVCGSKLPKLPSEVVAIFPLAVYGYGASPCSTRSHYHLPISTSIGLLVVGQNCCFWIFAFVQQPKSRLRLEMHPRVWGRSMGACLAWYRGVSPLSKGWRSLRSLLNVVMLLAASFFAVSKSQELGEGFFGFSRAPITGTWLPD